MAGPAKATPDGAAPFDGVSRTTLVESPAALVEDVRAERVEAEGFSPDFQLVLPYRGVLVWQISCDSVVSDPNQVMFVTGGEAYRTSPVLPGGLGALIITPNRSVLAELAGAAEDRLARHLLFRRRRPRWPSASRAVPAAPSRRRSSFTLELLERVF